jgi:hypothetical protein
MNKNQDLKHLMNVLLNLIYIQDDLLSVNHLMKDFLNILIVIIHDKILLNHHD